MNKKILIVDDMMLNIDVLTEILSDTYTIMAAVSGESAIKILGRKKPDLVLLDVSMPGIDGFEVLRFIKGNEELADIPVIFVSGEHDAIAEEKGLALGAADYIKKPYSANVVKVKVRDQLELKSYRDGLEGLVYERTKELEDKKAALEKHTEQLEKRARHLAVSYRAIIMGMSIMSESYDKITDVNIENIKLLAKILTEKISELYPDIITADLADQTVLFSPLHDIGMVSIPDIILKKNGKLSTEEFDTIKEHTLNAITILSRIESLFNAEEKSCLNIAKEIVGFHHEKYDGTGYPHGLKGDEIPLSARIVALADIYDSLRNDKPYRKAYTHAEAVGIISCGDGRTMPQHFDKRVLETFSLVEREFEKIYIN